MLRASWIVVALLAVFLPSDALHSAEEAAVDSATDRSVARTAAVQKRREWLRARLAAGLHDAARLAELNAKLDRMSAAQIDQLSAQYLAEQQRRRQRQREAQNQRRRQRDAAARDEAARRAELGRGRARPGFLPVITWFPEGASLTASAVVSPDGRYVRVRAMPFFSTIGPVHTFNFFTGETRLLHPGPRDPFLHHPPPQPRIWHDGLRTRP